MKKMIIFLGITSLLCLANSNSHIMQSVWGDTMKIRRFRVGKLVRDKVPSLIAEGINSHERIMDTAEYKTRLKMKLIEEAREVESATTHKELAEEMADVLEVFWALAKAHDISEADIEEKRVQKLTKRGGFEQRFYSPYVDVVHEHPLTAYYQARPQEYPEINADSTPQKSVST